jgi:hypothetical protein
MRQGTEYRKPLGPFKRHARHARIICPNSKTQIGTDLTEELMALECLSIELCLLSIETLLWILNPRE